MGARAEGISATGPAREAPPPPPPPPPEENGAPFNQAVQDAQAQRAAVEGKPPESHGYETAVPVGPGGSIEGTALQHGADPQQTVEANAQYPDPNVVRPGDIVFVPNQSPVSANTESLIDDAVRFDREHPGATNATQSDQNWNKVQDAIAAEMRDAGQGQAQPEQGAQETSERISAWAVGTDRLRQASQGALQEVTGEWREQGVTGDTLGRIEDAYGRLRSAQDHETAVANDPTLSPSAREVALNQAQQATDREATAVRDEIASQLEAAGNANPDALPLDRIQAIQDRAERIKALGPQEGDFQALVGLGAHKVLVSDPAQRISDAYAQGGATDAAAALKTELSGTAPDYAAQILTEAQPTVDRIASDLGDKVALAGDHREPGEAREQAFEESKQIYTDLATGVQNAGMSSTYGRQAVDGVANALAANTPDNLQLPGSPTALVHEASVRDGSTTLSLAYAGALHRANRTGDATFISEQIAHDIDEQRQVTERATDDFFNVTGELNQHRADWAGTLTKEQMDAATRGYVTRNPDFLGQFQSSLQTLQSEGNAAENMARSVAIYGNEVDGIPFYNTTAREQIDGKWQALTGDNAKVAFAMQQGGQSNADIASVLDGVPGSGAPTQTADPIPTSRSVRTLVKESLKASVAGLPNTQAAQLNGAGSLLYGIGIGQGAERLAGQPNVLNAAIATYQGLGFTKETSELLARTAPQGLIDRSAVVNRASDFVLNSQGWKTFDTYFKVGAVGIDVARGVDYLLQGDPVAAGISGVSATGNAMMALAAARSAGTATLGALAARLPAAFSSGPWGAGVVLAATIGQFGWNAYQNAQRKEDFQNGMRDFLIDSGAVGPQTAEQLSRAEIDGDSSIGPLLGALADYQGTTGPQMLSYLDRQDSDQRQTFLDIAEAVERDGNGDFKETAPNDQNFLPPGVPNYTPLPEGDRLPRSLRGLALRESAVFGYGDSPSAPVS
jgi:hypothetical protein